MTAGTFYKKLEEAGNRMVWFIDGQDRIRGKFKYGKVKRCFCPITAVCYLESRKFYDSDDLDSTLSAAEMLNINYNFAHKIIMSADRFLENRYGSVKTKRKLKKLLSIF